MALPKKYDFNDYDNYLTDPNPTTSAEAQDYFRNMDMLVGALIDAFLWQPETNYKNGDVVKSPSMPNGAEAVCVAENGGKSSNVEPQWGNVGGVNVADGTCFWKLRWGHWSKENATNRLQNTTYNIGDVVYHKSNLKVALNCTTAGTTSNTELDISGVSVGESVEDGSVVWKTVSRSETYNTYTTFGELKLTDTPTLMQILEAMPSKSKFVRYISSTIASHVGVPDGGILEIVKGNYNDYASLRLQRYGGDAYLRKAWYESWVKGQTTFKWEKLLDSNDFATQSETVEGLKKDKVVTPSTLKDAIDARNFATKGALSMPLYTKAGIAVSEEALLSTSGYEAPTDGWLAASYTPTQNGFGNWARLQYVERVYLSVGGSCQAEITFRLLLPMSKGCHAKIVKGDNVNFVASYFYPAQSEV